MVDMSDDLLTVSEVCTYLRKSRSTVYRLTRAGFLPARKVGGTWRYSRRSLDEWLHTTHLHPTTIGDLSSMTGDLASSRP